MDFRKRLWMNLERILMKQVCGFNIQPFINKDPDPRNRDYTFILTGDSCEVEIAFFTASSMSAAIRILSLQNISPIRIR